MRDSFNYSTFIDLVYTRHDWQEQDKKRALLSEQEQQGDQTSTRIVSRKNSREPWRGE